MPTPSTWLCRCGCNPVRGPQAPFLTSPSMHADMPITQLNIRAVRNISDLSLSPSPGINIIHGANGSGKSSLLEAIHLLGHRLRWFW